MKRRNLILTLILIVALITTVFVGCKAKTVETTVAVENTKAAETTVAETKTGETTGEQVVLTFTDFQAGVTNILNTYTELFSIFEKQHPGVKIKYTQYGPSTYNEFLKPAISAGDAPDMFAVYPGMDLAELSKSGGIEDLTNIIDSEWKSWLGKSWDFNGIRYDGKVWAIPQDAQTEAIWIHKDMLRAAGMEVPPMEKPVTVDDLIALVKPAKEKGWNVITAGFMDYWVSVDAFYNFVHQQQPTDTPDMVEQAMAGKISWQQDIFRNAFEAYKKMNDAGVWKKDSMNMDYTVQSFAEFMERKAIGYWCTGDWFAGSMKPEENNPNNPNIGIFMYPLVNADATPAYNFGFGTDIAINAKGGHKDLVKEFMKLTNSPQGSEIFLKNYAVPAAMGSVDITSLKMTENPIFNDCVKMYSNRDKPGFRRSEYFYSYADMQKAIQDGIISVMLGTQTIDAVLTQLNKAAGYQG